MESIIKYNRTCIWNVFRDYVLYLQSFKLIIVVHAIGEKSIGSSWLELDKHCVVQWIPWGGTTMFLLCSIMKKL